MICILLTRRDRKNRCSIWWIFLDSFLPLKRRKSKMMFSDWWAALRKICSIVDLPFPFGDFISQIKPLIMISGLYDLGVFTLGINSTSYPSSVKNTTVLYSCGSSITPFGIIFPFRLFIFLFSQRTLLIIASILNKRNLKRLAFCFGSSFSWRSCNFYKNFNEQECENLDRVRRRFLQ